jgi:hypothetical protein
MSEILSTLSTSLKCAKERFFMINNLQDKLKSLKNQDNLYKKEHKTITAFKNILSIGRI